jgi:hypothetical protein
VFDPQKRQFLLLFFGDRTQRGHSSSFVERIILVIEIAWMEVELSLLYELIDLAFGFPG